MSTATELVQSIRDELAPTHDRLLAHPYVAAVEAGGVELARLRPLAGEQHAIISSDLRSVAHLVARYGSDFFLGTLSGERAALDALSALAEALGMTAADLDAYEPQPGAFGYAAYMAWLAANASDAEVAAAYLVNFQAWGENCGRLSLALRSKYGLSQDAVRFFDLFAEPVPGFDEQAEAVIAGGLARGVPEPAIRRAPRLLQAYELGFWDTLQAGLSG
jgi:thiaminase